MTTSTKRYNGYTNYETWCVNLWLENDEATYNAVKGMAECEERSFRLANNIKEFTSGLLPDLGGTLAADLLGAAMESVNWVEIAELWYDEYHGEDMDESGDETGD